MVSQSNSSSGGSSSSGSNNSSSGDSKQKVDSASPATGITEGLGGGTESFSNSEVMNEAPTLGTGKGQQHKQQQHKKALYLRYPVNSSWEFTVQDNEVISGTVYCTDEVSQTVVLQKPLHHTTTSVEMRIVQVACIQKEEKLPLDDESSSNNNSGSELKSLPAIQKKILEEREKKAIRLAEESFRHINQNATSKGQAVFDRLLKACNEVVWKGESILVLNQIQVDPPYGQEECKILKSNKENPNNSSATLQDGSLDRVKKIVAATASAY